MAKYFRFDKDPSKDSKILEFMALNYPTYDSLTKEPISFIQFFSSVQEFSEQFSNTDLDEIQSLVDSLNKKTIGTFYFFLFGIFASKMVLSRRSVIFDLTRNKKLWFSVFTIVFLPPFFSSRVFVVAKKRTDQKAQQIISKYEFEKNQEFRKFYEKALSDAIEVKRAQLENSKK